tara:strand:+ start:95 stop:271 length:177 start_codon:yes stop_codon:yes gene_type:complete
VKIYLQSFALFNARNSLILWAFVRILLISAHFQLGYAKECGSACHEEQVVAGMEDFKS